MRARPDGVYATRRAPAMRAENRISGFLAGLVADIVRNLTMA